MTTQTVNARLLAHEPTCPRDADGQPRVFFEAHGAYLVDGAGTEWLDFDNARGSVLLGHGHPEIADAVARAARGKFGSATGWSPLLDSVLGYLHDLCGGDAIGLYRTGTAAVRSAACAVRTARDRPLILSSGYHGFDPMWHCDKPFVPNADGIVDFLFDLDMLADYLSTPDNVAAIVLSPDLLYLSDEWYGQFTRMAREAEVPVIADEVKIGLRYRPGLSATGLDPAVWVVSKGLSNGIGLAAVGGQADLLGDLAEVSFTSYFEPTILAAAIETLARMASGDPQRLILRNGDRFIAHAREAFARSAVPIDIAGCGNLFQFACANDDVHQAFYAASADAGLLFFEGDNQCPSAAFTDSVVDDACARLDSVCDALANRWPDVEITEDARYAAAWCAMDGLAGWPRSRERTTQLVQKLWDDAE